MTEDTMIHEPDAAIATLTWLESCLTNGYFDWKIFFRPNVLQWLSDICDTWPDDK